MVELSWDVGKVFNAFGSPEGLIEAYRKSGYTPPNRNTLYIWKHRNRIPGNWAASLVRVASEHNINLLDCIFSEKDLEELNDVLR